MDLLEKIIEALQDRKTTPVAEATGIHPNTIRAIRRGERTEIRWGTIKALADYLELEG